MIAMAIPAAGYVDALSNRCNDHIAKGKDSMQFPTITAKTLANRCVTFPDETAGRVGVIFVAFEQGAQSDIDSWVEPMIKDYLTNDEVSYFEIPMISGLYKPVSRFIDGGMRGGVPTDLHDRTATFYGKRAAFFSQMKIEDTTRAYLFVLSRSGRIVHRASGRSSPKLVAEARAATDKEIAAT